MPEQKERERLLLGVLEGRLCCSGFVLFKGTEIGKVQFSTAALRAVLSRGCSFLLCGLELSHESNPLSGSDVFPLKQLPELPPITAGRALAVP